MVREAEKGDLQGVLELYTQLHGESFSNIGEGLLAVWDKILNDKAHHVIVAEEGGEIVSSCVCVIIPNLTHGQRSYAVIENVVTDEKRRCKGYATECLDYAREIALAEGCYKMMLMTGSKKESTLHFYEQAGYNRADKTAFVQWLRG